ncbi:MAG: CHASE3 domain-containing protein [Thiotrichaceae bacterium]|nr:CHASE3 domain-containing protein [Thiotrichaceae bacterium]
MTLNLKTKIAVSLSIVLILFLLLSIVAVRSLQQLVEASNWVEHTYQSISHAKMIQATATDMETSARGFLLTGQEAFLQPYLHGVSEFNKQVEQLQTIVSDNPKQVKRLEQAEEIIQKWREEWIEVQIELRRKIGDAKTMNDLAKEVAKARGKTYFDTFRQQIKTFINQEKILLNQKSKDIEAISESDNLVEQIYEEMTAAKTILTHGIDMETGMRGFLLSGKEEFLEPYNDGKKSLKQTLYSLKQTVSNHPAQMSLLEEITHTLEEWQLKVVEPLIHLRRQIGDAKTMDDVAKIVGIGKGKQYFDQFREKMADFSAEEQSLMVERREKSLALAEMSINSLFWGTAILLLFGIGAGIYIIREILYQIGGEPTAISHITAQVAQGNLAVVFEDTGRKTTGVYASVQLMVKELRLILNETGEVLKQLADGNMQVQITGKYAGDFIHLKTALESTASQLAQAKNKNETENWLKSGQTQFSEQVSGEQDIKQLSENIINFLTPYVNAKVGVFHSLFKEQDNEPYLKMIASHAYVRRTDGANTIQIGDGIVGQAAYEKKSFTINHSPKDYINIQSSLGEAAPTEILVIPFLYESEVKGVIELASLTVFTDVQLEFLAQIMPSVAIAINTAESRTKMQALLEQSQAQSEELISQQEQMQQTNEELQAQTEELRSQTEQMQSQQEELQVQQEELRQTNEELEARDKLMTEQQAAVKQKNQELEKAKIAIQTKAEDLELASKYKSEFLANMSHELRTPLNSLLILAQLLIENKEQNLSNKQLECAQTIYSAGNDLLTLINEILDLSKVEAGKVEIQAETIVLSEMVQILKQKFMHVAEEKSLYFEIKPADDLPDTIYSDTQRLNQIINNLLSNGFKFTKQGGITLEIRHPNTDDDLSRSNLDPDHTIAISVSDTGIGIAKEKQRIIFEAFQQADGTTSRRFGGTGLGLSISRQLAQLMGGEIQLSSETDQGSCFTIFLPETYDPAAKQAEIKSKPIVTEPPKNLAPSAFIQAPAKVPTHQVAAKKTVIFDDDREHLQPKDKSLLIIEDEHDFARIIQQLAQEKGFKCLLAADGRSGIELAEHYKPSAIILDIGLPEVDGFSVMEHLKDNSETRHIPVHFISGDSHQQQAKNMGAIGYALKPIGLTELGDTFSKIEHFIDKAVKNLLVIADSEEHYQNILDILDNEQVQIVRANHCAEALEKLAQAEYECVVLDLTVENDSGIKLLTDFATNNSLLDIPIIIYPERPLTAQEETALQTYNSQLTLKTVMSPEHLLDEATLFLHQVESHLPQAQQEILKLIHDKEAQLRDKKILLVDDDARNVFALTATLESKGMKVFMAPNGKRALEQLEKIHDIDIVLMDIMMPEMDGYETMQRIRQQSLFRKLPIIALTAKAMKEDANKCIEAGASDYLAKPVDMNKLLSLMRVWAMR